MYRNKITALFKDIICLLKLNCGQVDGYFPTGIVWLIKIQDNNKKRLLNQQHCGCNIWTGAWSNTHGALQVFANF